MVVAEAVVAVVVVSQDKSVEKKSDFQHTDCTSLCFKISTPNRGLISGIYHTLHLQVPLGLCLILPL